MVRCNEHDTVVIVTMYVFTVLKERQDAVTELVEKAGSEGLADLDFVLVVGGFDSSNTAHLKEIPEKFGTFFIIFLYC